MATLKRQTATVVRPTAQAAWRERERGWRRAAFSIVAVVVVLGLGVVALSGRVLGGRDLLLPLGIVLMVALAYANGANDVSKAIATLAGSGVTNYRRAIAWGAGLLGLAAYLAFRLVRGGA